MESKEGVNIDYVRLRALELAISGSVSSEHPEQVVQRAKLYLKFLTGDQDNG